MQASPTEGSQEDGELITWYRKTCLGMGAGLAMSLVRQGYYKKEPEVFIPPRAEKLPPEVVDRWVRNVRLKQKVTTVGRETMMVAAVSGAYFGIESICKQVRGVEEPSNTGLAGLVAGGMLGALLPGPVQARTVVLVGLMGGVLGYTTAWLSGLVPPPPPPPSSSSTGASS